MFGVMLFLRKGLNALQKTCDKERLSVYIYKMNTNICYANFCHGVI